MISVYRRVLPYAVAIASTVSALLLTLLLEPFLTQSVSIFFSIAIILSTWYGGLKPGFVSVILSTLAINIFLIPNFGQMTSLTLGDVFRFATYVLVSVIIHLLNSSLKTSQHHINQLNRQLLADSHDRLQIALKAAQMGMWDWDLVTGQITWSPEHESLLGLPAGSFDGRYETFDACLHPDDRENLNQAIAFALNHRKPYHHEYRVIWPDGSIHWVEGRGQAFHDQTGQPIRMSGTIIAIDERKQAQTLLQQQLEQQRLVMEITQHIRQSLQLSEILQTTVDEVRQFLQCDRVIMFQFLHNWRGLVTVESVIDPAFAILSTPIYDPCIGESYIEPFEKGLVTAKADIYNADISPCHSEFLAKLQVRANLVVPILKHNQLWGLLVAHHCTAPRPWQNLEIDLLKQIAIQVSIALQQSELLAQVQTELTERKQAEIALRASETRLRLAQSASKSGVWDWDIINNTFYWSPEYYALYQLDPNISADYNTWLACLHPEDREVTHQKNLQALTDPNHELRTEFRVLCDDQILWFAEIGQVVHNAAHKPIRMIGITIDITQQKLTEIALKNLNAQLEQRVEERTTELTLLNNRLLATLKEQHQTQIILTEQAQLLDLAHDTIMTLDLDGVITFWNQGAESMYGWTKAEALGHPSYQLLNTQFPDSLTTLKAELLAKGYWEGELTQTTRDHRLLIVASRWVLQRDNQNRPIKILKINNDITARKQAELALQNYISEIEDLYENAPCGYHSLDSTGLIVRINNTELNWLGYSRDEILNKKRFIDLVSPEYQSVFEQNFPLLKEQGWLSSLECKMISKDGSTRWICLNATSIQDEAGNFLMSRSSLFDISDRKQIESVLQRQTQQKQLLWNITQIIRQSLDLDHILNAAVISVRKLLQIDRTAVYRFNLDWSGDFIAESVTDDWIKLVETNRSKVWEDTYLQETQGGRFRNHEILAVSDIYQANLQPCHIELLEQFQAKAYAVAPIFVGEFLWGLFALYQNSGAHYWTDWEIDLLQQITGQLAIAIQQAQLYSQLQNELEERQQTVATLREAERRWQSLLNNVQLIVVGLDVFGKINYINPFFLRLTGYTEAEILGQDWFSTFLVSSHQQTSQTVFQAVIQHNSHPYYREYILTKKGEEKCIAWNNTRLQDSDGTVIGTISIGEDITERQKVEEIKHEFISIVSHELRTPLTAIQMSLGLLKMGIYANKPDKAQRMIEIALIDTNRLVNLVNDILDLERLEAGRAVLEKTVCPASNLLEQAVNGMLSLAMNNNITLAIIPTEEKVWASPDAIIQTLTNLLSNAIKFSPPKSVISLRVERQAHHVLFEVSDQGRGIPTDKLEAIFGRFQQVDASDSREKGGTGLGLPICRSIIERHNGKIWVESTVNVGSSFFFTLPIPPEDKR